MVLANTKDVEADLVGELDLLEQVAESLLGAQHRAGARIEGGFRERVKADLHGQFRLSYRGSTADVRAPSSAL